MSQSSTKMPKHPPGSAGGAPTIPRPGARAGGGAIHWISDGFGFCPASGEWFTANETALAVIEWRLQGLDSDAIADRLSERYQVTRAAALRDLQGPGATWAGLVGR